MRKILYLWMICVVLCSLVSCNDSDDKTYSSYVSRFVWENRCNHRIEYFYVEGCITRSQGIKYGERAVKELEDLRPWICRLFSTEEKLMLSTILLQKEL